ncbi:hypothetical protein Dimus_022379 [Dionaea muscipula]
MSTASSPSDPDTSDNLPNAASLAFMVLPPTDTSSNLASHIPSSSNAVPGARHTKIVRRSGLARVPIVDFSLSLQSSPEPSPSSNPHQNDPSSSLDSDDDSDDNSDASGSEDDPGDSDDSSSNQSLFQPQPHEHAHAPLSEGADSSMSNHLCPSSVTNPDAEPFVKTETGCNENWNKYFVRLSRLAKRRRMKRKRGLRVRNPSGRPVSPGEWTNGKTPWMVKIGLITPVEEC